MYRSPLYVNTHYISPNYTNHTIPGDSSIIVIPGGMVVKIGRWSELNSMSKPSGRKWMILNLTNFTTSTSDGGYMYIETD